MLGSICYTTKHSTWGTTPNTIMHWDYDTYTVDLNGCKAQCLAQIGAVVHPSYNYPSAPTVRCPNGLSFGPWANGCRIPKVGFSGTPGAYAGGTMYRFNDGADGNYGWGSCNCASNQESTAVSIVGHWTGTSPYLSAADDLHASIVFKGNLPYWTGIGDRSFCDVLFYNHKSSTYTTTLLITVFHIGGATTMVLNQRGSVSAYETLGRYAFGSGDHERVKCQLKPGGTGIVAASKIKLICHASDGTLQSPGWYTMRAIGYKKDWADSDQLTTSSYTVNSLVSVPEALPNGGTYVHSSRSKVITLLCPPHGHQPQ